MSLISSRAKLKAAICALLSSNREAKLGSLPWREPGLRCGFNMSAKESGEHDIWPSRPSDDTKVQNRSLVPFFFFFFFPQNDHTPTFLDLARTFKTTTLSRILNYVQPILKGSISNEPASRSVLTSTDKHELYTLRVEQRLDNDRFKIAGWASRWTMERE